VLLYAYAFQIYFDFSGYTDIAIGLGRLLGIKLPENFNAPYLKPNLTYSGTIGNMTLTQWFRAYFFNPVTRALRSSKRKFSISGIVFITQMGTMVLIGLWHGVTWNFVAWGVWHGLGLFVHNRWVCVDKRALCRATDKLAEGVECRRRITYISLRRDWLGLPLPCLRCLFPVSSCKHWQAWK